jgi:hypothetical protein
VRPEGLGKLKRFINFIGSRTRDLPDCSVVPQPLRYRVPHTDESVARTYKLSAGAKRLVALTPSRHTDQHLTAPRYMQPHWLRLLYSYIAFTKRRPTTSRLNPGCRPGFLRNIFSLSDPDPGTSAIPPGIQRDWVPQLQGPRHMTISNGTRPVSPELHIKRQKKTGNWPNSCVKRSVRQLNRMFKFNLIIIF